MCFVVCMHVGNDNIVVEINALVHVVCVLVECMCAGGGDFILTRE